MRNRALTLALLSLSLLGIGVVTGCGGGKETEAIIEQTEETEAIIEPTEETESTEAIEPTEETLEITDETYPGFAKENININAEGVVIDYNEKFIAECKKYDTFRECSDDEIKEILKTVIEESMGKIERTPEEYHKTLSELDKNGVNAKDLLQLNEEASSSSSSQTSKPSGSNSNSNTKSNSNKGNTGSNNTSSTPSQDADLTKGYGDAGGSSTSEAPVQSVDDGFEDMSNVDCSQFSTDMGENTGATGLIQ